MSRALGAVLLVGALVASAPGAATAVTNCSVAVCADASGKATWTCTPEDQGWGILVTCVGVASAVGGGSSPLSIPGSATYTLGAGCRYASGGSEYPYCGTDQTQGPVTCTWAGLGEDSCSGAMNASVVLQFGLSSGQCLGQVLTDSGQDYVMRAEASSSASKSLPILGGLDSATATDLTTGSLAAQSATVCA